MPVMPAELTIDGGMPAAEELVQRLLSGETLLADSPDHVLEVVGVLESYGEVLDAYSINLIYQAEHQFLNPFPVFKYFNGEITPGKIWRYLNHDRINFEYAEYCMKAMLW
ncbi:MAG: CO2 hydration protein, partial [Prochlorococcaceae cyanobacterium]